MHPTLLFLWLWLLPAPRPQPDPGGIRFFGGTWQQALDEARRQHKPIYLDVYTTWCPPCQRMAREAFPNPAVGAAFNDRFIVCQVNAELGEGPELARRYGIASYPTALYFTPAGELVHRSVGYAGVSALVQQPDLILSMPIMRRALRRRPTAPVPAAMPAPAAADSLNR